MHQFLEFFVPKLMAIFAMLSVGACTATGGSGAMRVGANALPEGVVARAAPWQDLTSAALLPADNCYWYLHQGPVETTMLPLRTVEGRPICAS